MLTEADRVTGHKLAAEWLESRGEENALVMADHLEQGGQTERAVPWLIWAAHAALHGRKPRRVLTLVERGVGCGASGEELGTLAAYQTQAHAYLAEWPSVFEAASKAMPLLPAGSPLWFMAAASTAYASTTTGNANAAIDVLRKVAGLGLSATPAGPYAFTMYLLSMTLVFFSQREMAERFLAQFEGVAAKAEEPDIALEGWLRLSQFYVNTFLRFEIAAGLPAAREAVERFEAIGDTVGRHAAMIALGAGLGEIGAVERAEPLLREVLRDHRSRHARDWAGTYLCLTYHIAGRSSDPLLELATELTRSRDRTIAACAMVFIARSECGRGRHEEAERLAETALREVSEASAASVFAMATMAEIAMARERWGDALSLVEKMLERDVAYLHVDTHLRWIRAAAFHAMGKREEARAAIRDARERILRVAEALESSDRSSFLSQTKAACRTMACAREWLGEEVSSADERGSPTIR